MVQNVSTAVMQRRVEPDDSLDDFPTPSWAARAMVEHVIKPLSRYRLDGMTCWEPACNRGYMARALGDYFGSVLATDIYDYGFGLFQHDFLMPYEPRGAGTSDWIITNPPFRLGEQFIMRARAIACQGVAIIVRSAFLEGGDRYRKLFSVNPPAIVAQHVERVIMTKGVVRDPAKEYIDEHGKRRRPSTATSYCWLVWFQDAPATTVTRMMWIPPCRQQMERVGDYPETP